MTHILLGISGSISAYKTPEIVRYFRKENWKVTPILTEAAMQFVTPLSLSTVSETDCLTPKAFMAPHIPHLKLVKSADIFVNAPISANTLAKLAGGWANDPVSATLSAFEGPVMLCPAMHTEMWQHRRVQASVSHCQKMGYRFLGPDEGDLASGDHGLGRLIDPKLLVLAIYAQLYPIPSLINQKIVITAGGTAEPIDPIRQITNASTGLSGEMLAHMASLHGANVTLITTRTLQVPNSRLQVIPVTTVSDLREALYATVPGSNRLYMSAAVSDFTVAYTPTKLSRQGSLSLTLTETPDLLSDLSSIKGSTYFIGYCLADFNLESIARKKLSSKGLDAIIANTSDQVGQRCRTATIYKANGHSEYLSELPLPLYSNRLLDISF